MKMSRSFMTLSPETPPPYSAHSGERSRNRVSSFLPRLPGTAGRSRPFALTLSEQPGTGECPKEVRGSWRNAEDLGRLFDREPCEIAKVDQFGGLGICRSELGK